MKFIINSKNIIDYLKSKPENVEFEVCFEDINCRTQKDMSITYEALKDMDSNEYLKYKNNKIIFQKSIIDKYESFYLVRKKLDNEYNFLIQMIRDTYAIGNFKRVKVTTALARPLVIDCIYNFTSTITIGLNKVLIDTKGNYNIEDISSKVRKYLNDYGNQLLSKAITAKKNFSSLKKAVKSEIQEFNDYRDTYFAHSDKSAMINVENIDETKALKIFEECLKYCVFLINLIDDEEISNDKLKEELNVAKLYSNYFSSQFIRK